MLITKCYKWRNGRKSDKPEYHPQNRRFRAMPNVAVSTPGQLTLSPGQTLTVTAATNGSGLVRRVGPNSQLQGNRITNLSSGQTKRFGPFRTPHNYSLEAAGLGLSYSIDTPQMDYANQLGNVETVDASFTLKETDNGKIFRNDTASNLTITVPGQLPEGFNI